MRKRATEGRGGGAGFGRAAIFLLGAVAGGSCWAFLPAVPLVPRVTDRQRSCRLPSSSFPSASYCREGVRHISSFPNLQSGGGGGWAPGSVLLRAESEMGGDQEGDPLDDVTEQENQAYEEAELAEARGASQSFMEEIRNRFSNKTADDVLLDRYVWQEMRERHDIGMEQELYSVLQKHREATSSSSDDESDEGGLGDESAEQFSRQEFEESVSPSACTTEFFPNTERTPNEVIMLLLENLRTPDEPYPGHGAEVFLRFSSTHSMTYSLSLPEAEDYIKSNHFDVLRRWDCVNYPRPLDLSLKGDRAVQPVRLRDSQTGTWHQAKFMFSKQSEVWLLDSIVLKMN